MVAIKGGVCLCGLGNAQCGEGGCTGAALRGVAQALCVYDGFEVEQREFK